MEITYQMIYFVIFEDLKPGVWSASNRNTPQKS